MLVSPIFRRATVLLLLVAAAAIIWLALPPNDVRPAVQPARSAVAGAPAPFVAPPAANADPEVASEKESASEPIAVVPLPEQPALQRRQDLRWQAPVPEPTFAQFREWTGRFAGAKTEAQKTRLLGDGIAMAEARRIELADLIDQNPQRALELAVPVLVRRQLPAEVVARLEESVTGRGDLAVIAAIPMAGQESRVRPIERTVTMADGRQFDTITFGERLTTPTRKNIAVQGIALDGKLALNDLPGRVLELIEVQEIKAGSGAASCPTSGLPSDSLGEEVGVDWDGASHTLFCGPNHAYDALIAAAGDELTGGGGGLGPIAQSGSTEGTKKLLIIRVDFPDAPGQVVSDATLTSLIGNMVSQWNRMSYGKMSWTALGSGSAFTPTLRLPNGHASYTGFGTMLSAARAAAADAGYNYQDYNFEVVVTGDKPDVGFGGVAYVGARGAWLANSQWNLGVCSHEVGHNFGLNHAGFWDTDDGSVIGSGEAVEYGNPFDHMGGASSSFDAHFGARQKNYLDWLADADVRKIGTDGQVLQRISAFDAKAATGFKAIAVDRAGTTNDYWIEYRGEYADTNNSMRDGVVLNWGPYAISNAKPVLLDNTPSTGSKDDCTVLIGRTFSDTAAGIHITPVARGTDATTSVRWMDVQVNRGAFAGNQKPGVTISVTNVNPAVNASVTCTAAASDPDGDTLGYYWEWGDGSSTANNSPMASHSWSSSGTKTVRCIVTDMKGQTATGQLLVQVGTSSTFFIQGVVATTLGVPVQGAVVTADATHTDTTDSEGYYAITGLAVGSYTLTATKTGLTIQPNGFTNPVVVDPNRQNINFVAPPGLPTFGTMKAGLLDQGSNTGPVILPVSDADTAVTALTLTGVSSNTAIIPNASITFDTVGTTVRTVTVSAAANVSGPVNITITATDPEGGTASHVWPVTVNAKPVFTATAQSTAENGVLDLDLRTLTTDDITIADKLAFDVSRVRNGSVTLLADGHTARFTPAPNYHGPASFSVTVNDRSLSSRTLFLYDFEPPDTTGDGKAADQSNFNRTSTFDTAGTGGNYSYTADVPAALAPYGTQSANLAEVGTGAARFRRTFPTTDLNFNDADWTFATWVRRGTRTTDDFIMHLGEGDGFGTQSELQLYFAANTDSVKLGKYGAAGLEAELVGADLAVGTWHHVAVVYDRTATNTGTFSLYVDGFLHATVTGVAMDISQSFSLYLGGAQSNTASLDRWFNGSFDDVLLQSGISNRTEIWGLAQMGAQHYLGLSATGTVNVTVTGSNQPPMLTDVPDVGLFVGGVSAPLPLVLSDAETEARNVTVTASSSNPALLPAGGIALSPAPAAWASSDLGTVSAAGSLLEDHGTFIIAGSGADIGGTGDEFRWVRQDLNGDGEIIARITSQDFTNVDAKAGVMMREAATATAAYALACVTPANGVSFHYRASTGATAAVNATVNGVAAPCWLRLVRVGGNFTASYAADTAGTRGPWQALGTTQAVTFAGTPSSAGLAVTSKADGTLCTAVFDRLGGTVKLGGERTITLTPTAGQQGTAMVTLTANDGAATAPETFLLTVSPNTPPTLSSVANISGTDGFVVPAFNVTLSDVHSAPEALTLTATSSNPLLLPNNRITISGTGATRTIHLAAIPSESGMTTITLTASDGTLTSTQTFTFTVNPGDPSFFVRSGANWRYLDTGANPAGWQQAGFNDAAWSVGPAQLGFGEGDESTAINATASRITTYFRHTFQCEDPADYAHLKVRLLRDDGAVLYLNGTEIYRSNMPAGAIAASTQAVLSAVEDVYEEVALVGPALVAGNNILAVEIHQKGTTSSDLSFDLEVQGIGPSPIFAVPAGAEWKYLDDGTDPGATWFDPAFNDSAWLSGPAQLGYGDGDEATTVASGPSGAHYLTTYFRRTFLIADPTRFAQLAIRLLRDDGAVIHLNGQELTRDNIAAGPVTTTTPAATSVGTAIENVWQVFRLDPAWLVAGTNTIAVEVHQYDATSSDISFDLQLLAYAHNSIPPVGTHAQGGNLTLTWPDWAAGWQLKSSTDFQTWTPVAGTPFANGLDQMQIDLPFTEAVRFFRLEAP